MQHTDTGKVIYTDTGKVILNCSYVALFSTGHCYGGTVLLLLHCFIFYVELKG